ncbi:MAG: biosynthetic arginine decarboxylase [Parachlamydiaceae bacterium]|nr:biosynthetic arginine decarboxylase [Parachlamydiaceae bacterium]
MQNQHDYRIKQWGKGYFAINSVGNISIKTKSQLIEGDLYKLTRSLVERGIEPPILIRFNDILKDRIHTVHKAFQDAIKQFNYRNSYRMAYPIKVNPQSHVVEIIQHTGKEYLIGLEVGSKPELIAVLALEQNHESLLLCNGYKDREYILLALMSTKLGRSAIIIIEQAYELELVLSVAKELNIEAQIGFRMKLSNKGTGRWLSSGGDCSKFGLFAHEIVEALEVLHKSEKTHWLKLLHFHLGSQITTIESIKKALNEGTRMYIELSKSCPSLCYFDVGGGLAVDYDGTSSTSDSSMNYTVEEYARDVVSVIGEACLLAGIEDPVIISESGRAIVSHHSVLVVEVIDVTSNALKPEKIGNTPSQHPTLLELVSLNENLSLENFRETFNDVIELKENFFEEFIYGGIGLNERAFAEKIYRILITKIHAFFVQMHETLEETDYLTKILRDTYFCNFSVFQSLPDSWAIGQLFPVMPLHRLNEEPTHQAILADISCDSDGKIDCFPGKKNPESYIMLHEYDVTKPYYLGIFLVGAYQEILGGLHNLFGDTNVVHVELEKNGEWKILRQIEGDKIEEVLSYVQYSPEKLMELLQDLIESSLKSGLLTPHESALIKKKIQQALESYTYLIV